LSRWRSSVENAVRRLEDESTDYETLGSSRFTIPVSVIVAAYNEDAVIESTVWSFLGFEYPEFEVIVANDGSTDATLDRLREAFDLEPYEVFVRHVFPSAPVRSIYRSRTYPNLVVIDKENSGKADTWNAALNVARYRYVCGVDADTVFDPRALLKVMRVAVRDPARIVGVTSQITTAREPERALALCCARPAGSRSGGATYSRSWAATRPRSPARTSSSRFASTSTSGARAASI
jgi:cellulose synthase/poly-beta-1,6-N-acetylglucosamine synthase-like glycosyltransferase